MRKYLLFAAALIAFSAPAYAGLRAVSKPSTVAALAANGANCSAGSAPLGVDASGAAESCTDFEEDLSDSAGLRAALSDETGTGAAFFAGGVLGQPSATSISFPSSGGYLEGPNGNGDTFIIKTWDVNDAVYRNLMTFTAGNTPAVTFLDGAILGTPASMTGTNISGTAASLTAGAATALAANGANCSAGSYPLGVDASGAAESCTSTANGLARTFFEFTNTGTPTVAQQGFVHRAPCAGTLTGYSIGVDAGTATVKFWKVASGTAVPTSSNSINTSGVAISSGTFVYSTTMSDFTTTTVTAGDIFGGEVTAVSGVTKISVQLFGTCN